MQRPLTTNDVRRIMVRGGAEEPSLKAVKMVADCVNAVGRTRFWELRFSPELIMAAAKECAGLKGDASHAAFRSALHRLSGRDVAA